MPFEQLVEDRVAVGEEPVQRRVDTPARSAMALVVAASTPCSSAMAAAASRILVTVCLLRSCTGARRLPSGVGARAARFRGRHGAFSLDSCRRNYNIVSVLDHTLDNRETR